MTGLRVALFSDSHYEANGVARTTCALEAYATRRNIPLVSVHAGPRTRIAKEGPIIRVELERWAPTSFALEHDLQFDVALWRHAGVVARLLRSLSIDVLHFTGPSDIGQLGAWLGHRLQIPMVGSWHTNLHEYASRRLQLRWLPRRAHAGIKSLTERAALQAELLFYRIPRVVLAPNPEVADMVGRGTGRPTFLMSRGVDTEMFSPARRQRSEGPLNIGYVGRLSPEKSVRVLSDLEAAIVTDGQVDVCFTIVGDGSERGWLADHMPRARFTGVLRGEALAREYADMDLFVFPSETETVGNVVLEALSSGVPVVAMTRGGPSHIVGHDPSTMLARDHHELVALTRRLVMDEARLDVMRAAARRAALDRSWDRIFDQVFIAYDVAVAGAGRALHVSRCGKWPDAVRQTAASSATGEGRPTAPVPGDLRASATSDA